MNRANPAPSFSAEERLHLVLGNQRIEHFYNLNSDPEGLTMRS